MPHISSKNVSEVEVHQFATEASDLGLPIGQWPANFTTDLGNGQTLVRTTKKLSDEGELLWVTYRQALGCISLKIFND